MRLAAVVLLRHGSFGTLALVAAVAIGCGSGLTPGQGYGDGGSGDGGGNGDSSYQYPGSDGGGGNGDAPIQACAAESTKAQMMPLGMYIMFDKSGSMDEAVSGGGTKWTVVRTALAQFLSQPTLSNVSVGMQFFPISSGGSTSCNAADYANPAVPIQPLSTGATLIAQAMLARNPGGNTPTSAAEQGAVNYARSWNQANPDHVVIVVLATDGQPTECDTSLANIAAIAAGGVSGTPKILTFVIGVGSSLTNLNQIAAGGGTTQAFIVDTNGNVGQQFLDALNAIRGAALGCVYALPSPDGGTPDFDKVNVQYTPGGGGAPQMFPRVADKASCPPSGDAWYYDNPSNPTKINLCDSTCAKVTPDTSGQVDVLLGCKTILE